MSKNLSEQLDSLIKALEAGQNVGAVLSPLPVTDLSMRYARLMSENKIRHYVVSYSAGMMSIFSGSSPENLVREYIQKNEGIQNVVFTSNIPIHREDKSESTVTVGNPLQVTDVSEILNGEKAILKSLKKFKSYSLIHQEAMYKTRVHRFLSTIIWRFNEALSWLNTVFGKDVFSFISSRKVNEGYYVQIHPVRFIAVAFEEQDRQEAIDSLINDLRILQEHDLIMGHLVMPSTLRLADIVGSGRSPQVLFCFPVINELKLQKALGKTALEMPRLPLTELGVRHENNEGDAKWLNDITPEKKYQVEIVEISSESSTAHEKYIENYKANVPFVNEIAASHREALKELKEMEKISHTHEKFEELSGCQECGQGRKGLVQEVHVKVDFKKKEDK